VPGSDPFRVLLVCSANVYRSPLAEFSLRRLLQQTRGQWLVGSAGVIARAGLPLNRRVAELLGEAESPAWASRRLSAGLITDSDLILTAEREHRAAVARLVPAAARRTWTLRQFARAAADLPLGSVADGMELLAAVAQRRPHLQPIPPPEEDIPDPVRRPARLLKPCARMIEQATETIAAAIAR
jgi:protein-tyrosine phosphatase